MFYLTSFFRSIQISLERVIDHVYRRITGLPQHKRSMITPHLYLGGQYGEYAVNRLEEIGITGIVNMRIHSIHDDGYVNPKLKILHLPTPDLAAPTMDYLIKGVHFIEHEISSGGKVYIHCRQGEGRGPSMAIAYLMSTGLTYDDAFKLVQKVRTFIKPTILQIRRLKEYEEYLKEKKEPHEQK